MTLALDRLSVRYGSRGALEPTSLVFRRGEFVGLIGPNGAGKTSLLKALAGLVDSEGGATWDGLSISSMPRQTRARTVAYLEQSPAAHWPLTIRDIVALGRLPHREFGETETISDIAAVDSALECTETTSFADRPITELSGGEQARVHLARALCVEASVLLVDEPIALLDPYHQLQIMSVLDDYARSGRLVIAVLHDLTLAARRCNRAILLHDSRVVLDGPPAEVLTDGTMRAYYHVEPIVSSHEREPIILPWTRL
jgi:iron complex transport system ATP-binding protein